MQVTLWSTTHRPQLWDGGDKRLRELLLQRAEVLVGAKLGMTGEHEAQRDACLVSPRQDEPE